MPNFTDSGIEQNLKNLTDEQLDQMIAETQQIRKDSMAQNVGKSLLQGGRAALLASQGQPISSLPQPTQEKKTLTPDEELNIFEKKERIKAKIKAEFGGGGGLQIVQLPGGGFAVVPGGSKSAEGAATDLAGKKDEQGDPIKLDNVKMNATGGLSGDFPKEQDQINRELDEEDQKRFKELGFDLIKGRLVNGNNLELLSGVTRDLSQVYADAFEEGGAGGFIQKGIAGAAGKIGDLPGGIEVGGRFPASGAFPGKRNELILKMMPMLTQQATKSEGSVRIVSSVLDAIGQTIPELGTAPKQADRQLSETLRTFYRFARGAERLNISLDDEFAGRNIEEVSEDEIAAWAAKVFTRMGSSEITGQEKKVLEGFLDDSLRPIRDIFARDEKGNKIKVGGFEIREF